MGLTGPLGVLPVAYTELVIARLRAKDSTLRDFLDIFNHRIISLFYRAWEKYRLAVAHERGIEGGLSQNLLALVGLGTSGLHGRLNVPDHSLVFYAGLLSAHPRSAAAFRQVLADYFDVPVEIEQFVGAWYPLEASNQCRVGDEGGLSGQLGSGAVVGDEAWDQQSRVRVVFGPLTFRQYRDFLPGAEGHRALADLAKFFTQGEIDVEVRLILRRNEVPACELSDEREDAPQLGWSTWARTGPLSRDPGDTVLVL
jgi:type VI secretion system protein ImpH